MSVIRQTSVIGEKARALGCEHEIVGLSITEAVRLIQRREGYTDCFQWDEPLAPNHNNWRSCGLHQCCWKLACDDHRSPGNWDPGTGGGGGGGDGLY